MPICNHCHKSFRKGDGRGSLKRHHAAIKASQKRKRNNEKKKTKKTSSSKVWPLNPDPWETPMGKRLSGFKEKAFRTYGFVCAWCGCGVPSVLEVAHMDGNRSHNGTSNLAILCLTCHRMMDLGIIPKNMVRKMRTKRKLGNWNILIHTGKKKKKK